VKWMLQKKALEVTSLDVPFYTSRYPEVVNISGLKVGISF